MKYLLIALLLCSIALCAQEAIPAGTVLPARLNSSLDSHKSRPGQVITARIMQDVPLPGGKIRAGAQLIGASALRRMLRCRSGRPSRATCTCRDRQYQGRPGLRNLQPTPLALKRRASRVASGSLSASATATYQPS